MKINKIFFVSIIVLSILGGYSLGYKKAISEQEITIKELREKVQELEINKKEIKEQNEL